MYREDILGLDPLLHQLASVLIPLFELHELSFIFSFLNSTNIFECLLNVLHCAMPWTC